MQERSIIFPPFGDEDEKDHRCSGGRETKETYLVPIPIMTSNESNVKRTHDVDYAISLIERDLEQAILAREIAVQKQRLAEVRIGEAQQKMAYFGIGPNELGEHITRIETGLGITSTKLKGAC